MKSCHDFDSIMTIEFFIAFRERYSIPNKYALHAPLLGQRSYNPYPNGFSVSIDALKAGLHFLLYPVIVDVLKLSQVYVATLGGLLLSPEVPIDKEVSGGAVYRDLRLTLCQVRRRCAKSDNAVPFASCRLMTWPDNVEVIG
ncbi:hypothetical protein BHE74_00018210 [Ensete ventricosum]|nr:hypothetical protein BHE74_00018210 [Ensete ventricosum]